MRKEKKDIGEKVNKNMFVCVCVCESTISLRHYQFPSPSAYKHCRLPLSMHTNTLGEPKGPSSQGQIKHPHSTGI